MAISSLLHLACASVLLVSSTMGMPSASVQGNPDWQSALERDTHYTFTDRSASLARASSPLAAPALPRVEVMAPWRWCA